MTQHPPSYTTKRVLIADDEANVRFALQVLLTQQPELQVQSTAADTRELLTQLGAACPDVILIDWNLGGASAEELLDQVRVICPNSAVVVLSSEPEVRPAALVAGARAFVSKTDPPDRLLETVRSATCRSEKLYHKEDDDEKQKTKSTVAGKRFSTEGGLVMYRFAISLLIVAALLLVGCFAGDEQIEIAASGKTVTQVKELSGFDKVVISHAFNVNLRRAEEFSVIIRLDEKLIDYLEVVQRGDTLRIGLDPDHSYSTSNVTMEAEITMPSLEGLELSGASSASLSGFDSRNSIMLGLSGSSSLRGDLQAKKATVHLSGSSRLTLIGSADDVSVHASGSSLANLSKFTAANTSVHASGASEVRLDVSRELKVSASGASRIFYHGNPKLSQVDTSGSSFVEYE